jgi:DNA processing protein
MTQERLYWLAWSQIKGIGSVLLKRIYLHFGSLSEAWMYSADSLGEVEGVGGKLLQKIREQKSKIEPERLYTEHSLKNPRFWTPADPEYPCLLWEIPSPPPVLYYAGTVEPKENQGITPLIGIVGTREPTEHGKRWTYNISSALATSNFTVVSGLAMGIDSYAHRGALEAQGRTIAVLGSGLDVIYPPSNRQLYEEILAKGLLLSEYPAGTRADKGTFPARNRIVAGLCRAILVMEAPEKSGALITAHYATEFNRDVYTLPNSPDNVKARGCLRLIHNGAEVIIKEEELLSDLGAIPNLDQPQQFSLFPQANPGKVSTIPPQSVQPEPTTPKLESPLADVYAAVSSSPTPFDVIVENSGLSAAQVSGLLLQLELEGLVCQLPGMLYSRK